jgi:DNA-binding CsgD family transcriptional regulator
MGGYMGEDQLPETRQLVYVPGWPSARITSPDPRLDDDLSRARLRATGAVLLANRGVDRAKSVSLASESLELSGHRDAACAWYSVMALIYAEEMDLVEAALDRLAAEPIWTRSRLRRDVLSLLRARVMSLTGRLREACGLLTAVLVGSTATRFDDVSVAWLMETLAELGEVVVARDLLADRGYFAPDKTIRDYPLLLAAMASLELAAGRYERGLNDYLACGRQLAERAVFNPAVMRWQSQAAICSAALQRGHIALHLAEEELAAVQRWGTGWGRGMALYALAVARSDESTSQLFRSACAQLDASPVRRGQARVRYDFATHLSERSHPGEAQRMFEQSRRLAEQDCNVVWSGRARIGMDRMRTADPALSLTVEEGNVAALARAGLTNVEISKKSNITVSTVEQHLSNVYRKLRISTRNDLSYALLHSTQSRTARGGAS